MVKYTISDALKKGIALLNENSIESPGLDARILLCTVLGCDTIYLTVHRDRELTEDESRRYFEYIRRRSENEPAGYITGKKEFMSLEFAVNPHVLIPRPDTEILVERAIDFANGIKEPVIVDMCTGSGAIAVSLAKYVGGSRVVGLDISSHALDTARENARINGVEAEFVSHDVLMPFEGICADCVVSNPPYIPTADIAALESNVSEFEPFIALDGGDDGLVFYRAIVSNISSCLKKGGMLAFEVGMGQAEDVMKLMEPYFENISFDCDLAGIKRVVYGYAR